MTADDHPTEKDALTAENLCVCSTPGYSHPENVHVAEKDALCSQCGEQPGAMLKIGTEDVWCLTCLDAAADTALRERIEALIGGPVPPIFLSDRPNKIVRVQHRDDRLCATVTESMVKVADIVAALALRPDTEGGPS